MEKERAKNVHIHRADGTNVTRLSYCSWGNIIWMISCMRIYKLSPVILETSSCWRNIWYNLKRYIYIGLKYYIITITAFWRCCIVYSFFDCRGGCSSISCNGDRRHNKLQYIIQRILKIYITATRNGTRRGYISRCVCVSTSDSFPYVL